MLFDRENTVQAKQWIDKCYRTLLRQKQRLTGVMPDVKCRRTDKNGPKRSGHTNPAVVKENAPKKLHKLVLADRKLKSYEIAEELKISEGSVFTILHEHLPMRKLCSNLVPRLLTSIKNSIASKIQTVVCNCFNAIKRSFCVNM